jgi:hypothetical protein
VDIASTVTLGAGQTDTNEATGPTLNVFVSRNDPAPVPLRVYLSFGGSATAPFFGLPTNWDYNVSGITPPGLNVPRGYIDIPAGQAFSTFSITPINDTRVEGDETIVISISSDPTYDIGNPSGTTLLIRDDDITGGPSVTDRQFLYETAPQRVTFRFNQDVRTSIGANDFSVTGPSGPVSFGFSHDNVTNTSTLSFAGILADGITNSSGQAMSADDVLPFFVLAGDANRDRVVDISDLAILATNWQQPGRTFSQGDFTYDGIVDISDLAILATNWQKSQPAAVAVVPDFSDRRITVEPISQSVLG